MWKHFFKKWLTNHFERQHAGFTNSTQYKNCQNESNSEVFEKPNKDNRTSLVGPNFSGKAYLMLKILSRPRYRDKYIIRKIPLEQYSNSKIKIKE